MPSSSMPQAALRILNAVVKVSLRRAVGDPTLQAVAEELAALGQEDLARRLDELLGQPDRREALTAALRQADACARERLASTPLHGLARDLPLRDLPSLLGALEDLPADDLEETRLTAALEAVLQRDWRLPPEQSRSVADIYLTCLREALLGVETDALLTVGRAVLRTEEAVRRLERALQAWEERERKAIRVQIEGSLTRAALVVGDHNLVIQTFVEPVRRLPTDYAGHIRAFLTAYLGTKAHPVPFGGREGALQELDAWLHDPETPYLLLTAPAGLGKSALLVRWLARLKREHPDLPVAFVPVSIRYGTNLSTVAFAALAAQLAHLHGEDPPTDPHTPATVWQGLVADYLCRKPPAGRLLVVVDGLDEAADWDVDAGLFPLDPPPGLKVAVSARLTATRPTPRRWRLALGWERLPVREMPLAPLTRGGLRDVLEKMGVPLDELARRPFIVDELYRLTQGDPLLTRLYVEDLWGKGEAALRLTPEDLRHLKPGYEGYLERWWEDQRRLWGKDAPLRERHVQEVLNLLAAALGPLPKEALLDLADPEAGLNSWTLDEALRPLARFVVHAPEGYIFGHPKLGEFFFGRLTPREQRDLEARFLAWGERTLQALQAGTLAPKDAPAYVVRYYRAHLERAGAPLAKFRALVETDAWSWAWEALQGSYAGYLSDVEAVWARARQTNEQRLTAHRGRPTADCGRPTAIGLEVRCALIEASIHSLAGNLPPKLPALLVENDLWTPPQALAHVRLMPDEGQRAESLVALAPVLARKDPARLEEALDMARIFETERYRAEVLAALVPHLPPALREEVLSQALDTARSIEREWRHARALSALVPHLPSALRGEVLAQALDAARGIRDKVDRARALAALAPHLPPALRGEVLAQALDAARNIEWQDARAEALAALAPHLPPDLLAQALDAAQRIRWPHDRVRAFTALAPHLPPALREEVLVHALDAARSIKGEPARARALMALALHLPPELLAQALDATRSIESEHWRARTLAALSPHLPADLLAQALDAARSIWNASASASARALAVLAPHLPEGLREQALSEALDVALRIRDEDARARALAVLAPHLPPDLLAEVLDAARSIRDADDRARVLASLAPHLPPNLLAQALDAARSIERKAARAEALAALAPHLPPDLLAQALDAARSIRVTRYHTEVLPALAPHLPPDLLAEALAAARRIWDESARARALADLAPHLPPALLAQALDAARSIERKAARAEALAALAPHLPSDLLAEVLDPARSIRDADDRARVLAPLAPHLPPNLLAQALDATRSIDWGAARAEALAALAPHLPPDLLAQALEAARSLPEKGLVGSPRAEALASLAPHLPAGLLAEALEAARSIRYEEYRAEALAALIPHLSEGLRKQVLREALEAARSIWNARARTHVLAALAPHLPEGLRKQVLREALEAARSIWDESARARALADLAPHLPPALLAQALAAVRSIWNASARTHVLPALAPHLPPELLAQALDAARSIRDEDDRAEALAALAPHLPEGSLSQALAAARHIREERYRAEALASLAPHLPPDLLAQALAAAQGIEDEGHRARALATLAPHLPAKLLAQALDATRSFQDADARARAFSALASRLAELPPERLYPLWAETLPVLARRTRPQLLADLGALAPVIHALGGQEAMAETARAIQDVGRWWG